MADIIVTIQDSNAILKDNLGNTLRTESILAENSKNILIQNSEVYINGTFIESLKPETDTTLVVKDENGAIVGELIGGEWVVPSNSGCPSNVLTMNGTPFISIASGDNFNVVVKNTLNTPIGTVVSGEIVVDDSSITINGNSFTTVEATTNENIIVKNTNNENVGSKIGSDWVVPSDTGSTHILLPVYRSITNSTVLNLQYSNTSIKSDASPYNGNSIIRACIDEDLGHIFIAVSIPQNATVPFYIYRSTDNGNTFRIIYSQQANFAGNTINSMSIDENGNFAFILQTNVYVYNATTNVWQIHALPATLSSVHYMGTNRWVFLGTSTLYYTDNIFDTTPTWNTSTFAYSPTAPHSIKLVDGTYRLFCAINNSGVNTVRVVHFNRNLVLNTVLSSVATWTGNVNFSHYVHSGSDYVWFTEPSGTNILSWKYGDANVIANSTGGVTFNFITGLSYDSTNSRINFIGVRTSDTSIYFYGDATGFLPITGVSIPSSIIYGTPICVFNDNVKNKQIVLRSMPASINILTYTPVSEFNGTSTSFTNTYIGSFNMNNTARNLKVIRK